MAHSMADADQTPSQSCRAMAGRRLAVRAQSRTAKIMSLALSRSSSGAITIKAHTWAAISTTSPSASCPVLQTARARHSGGNRYWLAAETAVITAEPPTMIQNQRGSLLSKLRNSTMPSDEGVTALAARATFGASSSTVRQYRHLGHQPRLSGLISFPPQRGQ